jgi:hypothetical protein
MQTVEHIIVLRKERRFIHGYCSFFTRLYYRRKTVEHALEMPEGCH